MTTERIQPTISNSNEEKVSVIQSVKMLFKNRALLGIMLASLGVLVAMFLTSALQTYMYKDYFQAPPSMITLGGMVGMLASFLIIPFTGKLVSKFGKKKLHQELY